MASRAMTRVGDNPTTPDPGFTIDGYVIITIGDQQFVLDGTVGAYIDVQYHKSFDEAVAIGTIPNMAVAIGTALGIAEPAHFKTKVDEAIANLAVIPGLPAVLNNLVIRITDLGINTSTQVYQFGFACDLSTAGISFQGVAFKGFGVKVTYAKQKA